ncbi:MAG: hypothetical protein ACT4P7_20145 [Gemmatimonadaceae bacterium]
MPGAPFQPQKKLNVHLVSQSPHTFAFQLWHAPKGATSWTFIEDGTIETPAKEHGPLPAETRFLYVLLLSGASNSDWQVQALLTQDGQTLACQPTVERGTIPADTTTAGRETAFVLK